MFVSNPNYGMLTFPRSRVDGFKHTNKHLRWGQAFYQYMQLHKCQQDYMFCQRLYNAPDEVAQAMVKERIDENN